MNRRLIVTCGGLLAVSCLTAIGQTSATPPDEQEAATAAKAAQNKAVAEQDKAAKEQEKAEKAQEKADRAREKADRVVIEAAKQDRTQADKELRELEAERAKLDARIRALRGKAGASGYRTYVLPDGKGRVEFAPGQPRDVRVFTDGELKELKELYAPGGPGQVRVYKDGKLQELKDLKEFSELKNLKEFKGLEALKELEGLKEFKGFDGFKGLEALKGLEGLEGLKVEGLQGQKLTPEQRKEVQQALEEARKAIEKARKSMPKGTVMPNIVLPDVDKIIQESMRNSTRYYVSPDSARAFTYTIPATPGTPGSSRTFTYRIPSTPGADGKWTDEMRRLETRQRDLQNRITERMNERTTVRPRIVVPSVPRGRTVVPSAPNVYRLDTTPGGSAEMRREIQQLREEVERLREELRKKSGGDTSKTRFLEPYSV